MRFPSGSIVEMAKSLKKSPNLQATEIKNLSIKEIMAKMEAIDGAVAVNITKATDGEKAVLRQAATLLPEGKVEFYVNTDEDSLLQAITQELCTQQELFHQFLENLWDEGSEHFSKEWDDFVVGHEVASKAHSVEDTHHWANIGLRAEHTLRERVRQLIAGVPRDMRDKLASLEVESHAHITSEEAMIFALTLAMVSNFVRGGVYYHLISPEKVSSYFPRAVAVKTMLSLVEKA